MATRKDKKEQVQQTVADETQGTAEPKVTMADIANALRIIDSAIERGSFRGKEISTVGATRDNLDRFVSYHEELQREQEEKEAASTGTTKAAE